jgi:hypothetical protein
MCFLKIYAEVTYMSGNATVFLFCPKNDVLTKKIIKCKKGCFWKMHFHWYSILPLALDLHIHMPRPDFFWFTKYRKSANFVCLKEQPIEKSTNVLCFKGTTCRTVLDNILCGIMYRFRVRALNEVSVKTSIKGQFRALKIYNRQCLVTILSFLI